MSESRVPASMYISKIYKYAFPESDCTLAGILKNSTNAKAISGVPITSQGLRLPHRVLVLSEKKP